MFRHQSFFSASFSQKVDWALTALRQGRGVLVVDDEDRENEGDLIFSTQTLTVEQTAMLIRECSGIICLCMPKERMETLDLPLMVEHNTNAHGTAFTVSIEAAAGVTTGVSARDRLATIRAATHPDAMPADLARPGHVFPLSACPGGVLERRGHTEATVDLMRLAGLPPYGVLCELTKENGDMFRLPDVLAFGHRHGMPVLSVEDIVRYRQALAA